MPGSETVKADRPVDERSKRAPRPRLELFLVIAALLAIVISVVIGVAAKFSGRPLPNGLHRPILAMEVPVNPDDIRLIIGCGAGAKGVTVPCSDAFAVQDRDAMR